MLIRGETGTGKELIARAIYQHSDRAAAPFIAVNCAAIPETLLESELFGHEKGAFTGAQARRIGRFEQAHLGTIFLDEIGDMTPGTQVKLLRVLEQKCLQRLGGKEDIPLDVRVIAATHSDLESAIRKKEFREDLYYRLNVVAIHLPPLRQRREDIPDLVRYFLRKHGPALGNAEPSIHPDAIEFLRAQPWPGNVRELENAVRKALLLAQNYTLGPDHFQSALNKTSDPAASAHARSANTLMTCSPPPGAANLAMSMRASWKRRAGIIRARHSRSPGQPDQSRPLARRHPRHNESQARAIWVIRRQRSRAGVTVDLENLFSR